MRINKLTIAALAVVAGLSLTACQNDEDTAGPSSSSAASTTPSTSEGASDSGQGAAETNAGKGSGEEQGTATGTGSDNNGKVGKCRTDELEVTATDNTIDGDPDGTVAVTFTNGGGRDCSISGYAGVDLKTSAGSLSAKRTGQQATSTVLKDGESVAFGITYPVNDSGGSGVRITGLVVTPPDETKSVSLDWPGAATLPVTDGSGTPVQVGPIGSAGQGG
ncbi:MULTISPECIES: DUF4232 domain-containing protein [Streptomyces]|jgi:hypothetical protein|uniref:DUF4232 domain-containing protein n=2 Tax=Streptomyces TaxID=1883 RepID=A0A514JSE5_9ACTN|nr:MULTISPECIES: DUF4232 domain-containing protein [Streptomyces]MBA8973939.1 hypothetical protein [Streptomyces calvus]MYS31762.1 DUF4232 domain-containing protein [Streptomyces sp. SID7804]QDI70265.1 hypothetical protein CD934_17345 [Streptomyces calvus]